MSGNATEWVWAQPLTGNKKLLLLAVAREVDRHGTCRATQEQLAEYCNWVRRLMSELSRELYLRGGPRRAQWRKSREPLRALA